MKGDIKIPNRFESLLSLFGEVRPLILPVEQDIKAFIRLRDRADHQNGGLLCFLLGSTGVGKTTSTYSVVSNMPDLFAKVVPIPDDVDIRDVVSWIKKNILISEESKTTLLLFDGREASDDDVGIKQFLSSLNQYLRKRPNILFCWPTTDAEWHKKIRDTAFKIGGNNLCPPDSDYEIQGLQRQEWPKALERLLLQFGKTIEDVGLSQSYVQDLAQAEPTIGEYLSNINSTIADRISKKRQAKSLPNILFVITSSADVTGEANRIRRAGKQVLAAEPLLGYSPRSEAGKWWTDRNKHPEYHLGYMISLFNANLVTCTASSVVYSCLHGPRNDLYQAAVDAGAIPNLGSASQAVKATELYKFLSGTNVKEFTTGTRGRPNDSTVDAYAAIQNLSAKRHKAINEAICQLVSRYLDEAIPHEFEKFEVSMDRDLIVDAILKVRSELYHVEFHHLSEAQCRASKISSYVMDKLRSYAIYYNIIPR
ncbi:MAG: hypothetical protein WBX25_02185 [Rhodomicrobium sp.]